MRVQSRTEHEKNVMKERYNIDIADIQLTILSDEHKDFVESTVAHLDETIRDMTVKNKRCSKLDAAILCALDFYSEKTKADKKIKNLEAQISLYEANIRRLKEEAEQLRAAAANTEEAPAEKSAEEAKPAKAARRVEQIAIPEEGNTSGEKSKEIETLLRPQKAAEETSDIPTTREGKLKAIEDLLRRGSSDAK